MGLVLPPGRARRRKARTLGVAANVSGVGIRGSEVTQTIQDLQNSVVLIAGKPTVARVYLDPMSVGTAGNVTGEITWRRAGAAGAAFLPAMNAIRLDPNSPKDIAQQRQDLLGSLNFMLPPEAVAAGAIEIKLNRVFVPGGADLPLAPQQPLAITFEAAPVLRIRVIGLRYRTGSPPTTRAPDAVHFSFLRSYLRRAYPVASVEWSQIVIDADFAPPFDKSGEVTALLANAQIAAVRSREVSGGIDPRTHYFGLVDDNSSTQGFFMRGRAFAIPATPRPDTVASGPCGTPNGFAGDRDASYADWYGAHELGHTFGRFHPGFPPGAQDASDPNFPYPDGTLTTADGRYVGFDVGDPALSIPMAVLPGGDHHDVMTYADDQWLSAYTYDAIFRRLIAEDQLVADGQPVA
jgi:hypothetical protein